MMGTYLVAYVGSNKVRDLDDQEVFPCCSQSQDAGITLLYVAAPLRQAKNRLQELIQYRESPYRKRKKRDNEN